MKTPFLLATALILVLSGCYHAKVTTGLPVSNETIDIPWAHSFIGGLVPPSVVDATSKCASGVAMVETKMSFLNALVGGITYGLYTPIHITVTCASAGRASLDSGINVVPVSKAASAEELNKAISNAAELSKSLESPVYIVAD